MQAFRIDDMTCGHCARTITNAIKAADKNATVTIDLAQHLVTVQAAQTSPQALSDAIAGAGYTPVSVQAPVVVAKPAKAGGCCGCCA